MGTFTGLRIGLSSLQSQQAAIEVTSGNVANVNTPGYHRRRVVMSESPTTPGGVAVVDVTRIKSNYLYARIEAAEAEKAAAQVSSEIMQQVEFILGATPDKSLSSILDRFFNALRELSAKPEDPSLRTVVVETGRDVAAAFNSLHSALSELQKSLGAQADQLVEQALKSARTAAEANAKAAQAGSKHPELADRRDQALRELAQVLGTKSSPDGSAAFIGGTSVVQDGWLREFGLTYSADGTQLIWLESGGAVQNVKGSLGETLRLRNEVLPAYIKQLDDLALSFANAVNELHKQGIDLDGNAGSELFFASTAADIRINPDIASSPRKLAVSESGAPGDGGIARRIADLADTVGEQYRTMLGRLGAEVRASRERAELAETSLQTLTVQEQSVSGVSLDEELSNLIQFQRAYEAAARIVSISNELALTILRMAES